MQTIVNVVGNAVKFSKEGTISITACIEKPDSVRDPRAPDSFPVPSDKHFYLRVQVKDSGPRISPQDIPKLFNKFARSHSLGSRNSDGTGLGLAICKSLVNLMEGHIWIESEGLGKGCTVIFIVKLGILEHSNQSLHRFVPKLHTNHRRANFLGLKVLVMDENGVSRMVTKGLLLHLRCDVTVVNSGDDCVRVVSQEHKVLFMDVCMTGMDGFEVAACIHQRFPKRHDRPLLVALTGNADKITKENCFGVGLDGVVLKPVSLEKMRSVLSDLLEHGTLCDVQYVVGKCFENLEWKGISSRKEHSYLCRHRSYLQNTIR